MDIILIRHGKAEDRTDHTEDAQRALTSAGRKKLQETLPGLHSMVSDLDKAQIWTSPFFRASQTAQIVSELFKIKTIRPFDFIATGDFEAITETLAVEKPKGPVLIIGHEPHLGLWSERFCGIRLPFKKGVAACFKIDPKRKISGELRWFFQPKAMGRLIQGSKQK